MQTRPFSVITCRLNFLPMKNPFLILICFFVATTAFAQIKADTVQQKIASASDKINVDSLTQLPQLPDSLLPSFHKVDSIRNEFNEKADSLKNGFENAVSKIDAASVRVNHTIDSLQNLNLPTKKYSRKLDSLSQVRQQTTAKFSSKADALKAKTTGKLNALDLPPQYKEPLQSITGKVDGFNLNTDFTKIPEVNIPGYSMPKVGGLGDLASKVGELGKVGSLGNLPKIETPVGNLEDVSKVTNQVKGYQGDVKNITGGNLNDVKELPKIIEAQAAKIDGVSELQKSSGVVDGYKDQLGMVKDPSAGKEKAVEAVKKAAVDHFAGKEEQLKAAMDKISKYKQKYSSVSSLKDLPKRPPNAMKGKPFIERLIPGFYFQYQQKNYNLFDINPYLSYRLSGRFTTGTGWNQRYAYDRKKDEWNHQARIYGPRAFLDFRLGKGFIAHLETEVMNTFVPSVIKISPSDAGQREWVWGMMTGLKKEYKIYKNLSGTVLIQFNLFNPKYKSPYVDRINSRIGFEYILKRKK
jgi:hypothetical protein